MNLPTIIASLGLSISSIVFVGPVFKPLTDKVDLGEVEYGGDAVKKFEFKNAGDENLLITDCKPSCGCTVPVWPKEPIKPGATGIIEVRYDSKRVGAIQKTITIVTNEVDRKDADGNLVYKSYPVQVVGTIKPAPGN